MCKHKQDLGFPTRFPNSLPNLSSSILCILFSDVRAIFHTYFICLSSNLNDILLTSPAFDGRFFQVGVLVQWRNQLIIIREFCLVLVTVRDTLIRPWKRDLEKKQGHIQTLLACLHAIKHFYNTKEMEPKLLLLLSGNNSQKPGCHTRPAFLSNI